MKTLLLGDLSPTVVTDPLFKEHDVEKLFYDTIDLFKGNDVNFVNLECALTECDTPIKKFGPPLKACAEVAHVLREIGVTCCGLSNNHIFDFGKKGIADTIKALHEAGLHYTGWGDNYEDSRKNLVIEKNDEKIAIIAVCEHEYSYALEDRMGSRPYDVYHTIEDIRAAKAEADRVIVIYHGGKEYCRYPSPRLYNACHAMARAGADVVLCQHTHCISCYEEYDGCHILYGQGNWHFVKPKFTTPECWDSGLAVKYDTKTHEIEFVPYVNFEGGIKLAAGEEKENIMQGFSERNQSLADGTWKNGWHEFCESVKDNYIGVVAKAYAEGSTQQQCDLFGHYFDCEAHHDVWAELFPTYNHTNEK